MRILILLFFICSIIFCQESNKEKNDILFISVNHTFQIPAGDLAKRFGSNSDISLTASYKTHNDWIFEINGGVLFGPTVKEDNLFNAINGDNGTLISQNGEIPTIRLFQRGGHIDISSGKYFSLNSEKSESGIVLSIGTGYIYHKIFIETLTTELPQLNEELIKGYDRLSGGLLTKQFIGYLHFSKKTNIRYLIGLECIQAFTKDLRGYNYTTQTYVTGNRRDYLFGVKCGFIVPIKQRQQERYYYY